MSGLATGRLVDRRGVADRDDDGAVHRVGATVGDRVVQLDARRRVGLHGDPQADAADLVDRHAGGAGEPGERDHVAVGIGVVLQHVGDPRAAAADGDVVAHGDRRAVVGDRVDVDADDRRVALAAVDDPVAEQVLAGLAGDEEELAVLAERHRVRARVDALRRHQRRRGGDGERVAVGVGVVGQRVERDRLADHGDRRVVARVGLVVRAVEADLHLERAVGRARRTRRRRCSRPRPCRPVARGRA